jgi:sulfite reductase alpha subunit-like flavoprotein
LEILRQGDDHPDSITLKKTITDNFMSVVDLFNEFPSAQITLEALLELLPKQKPRLYSISSCLLSILSRSKSQLECCKLKRMQVKPVRDFVPTTLPDLKPGAKVRISVRTSSFRPPSDPTRANAYGWDRVQGYRR